MDNYFKFCGYTNEIVNEIAKTTKCNIKMNRHEIGESKFQTSELMINSLINVLSINILISK